MVLATAKSPKLNIPFRYLFTGTGILIFICLIIVLKPEALTRNYFRSPVLLPLTHLLTLGCITITIIGAMFQLVPVIAERQLYSEDIARAAYYIYIISIAWLIYAFSTFNTPAVPAGLLSLAILLFIVDMILTFTNKGTAATQNGVKLRRDISVWFIVTAIGFLFITLITGSIAAAGLDKQFIVHPMALLHMHIAIAGIGFVTLVIIGFSFKLVPMFILSHGYEETKAWVAFVLFLSGIILLTLHFFLLHSYTFVYWLGILAGIIIFAGIIFYVLQMLDIYSHRARKHIDPGIWLTITATGYLIMTGVLGLYIIAFKHSSRLDIAYAVLGLFGWAVLYIMGMMHKIVPFLHWYNKYSSKIGLQKVPMTKDMISERLAWIQLYLSNIGLILLVSGIMTGLIGLIFAGGIILFADTIIYGWNIFNVIRR